MAGDITLPTPPPDPPHSVGPRTQEVLAQGTDSRKGRMGLPQGPPDPALALREHPPCSSRQMAPGSSRLAS